MTFDVFSFIQKNLKDVSQMIAIIVSSSLQIGHTDIHAEAQPIGVKVMEKIWDDVARNHAKLAHLQKKIVMHSVGLELVYTQTKPNVIPVSYQSLLLIL